LDRARTIDKILLVGRTGSVYTKTYCHFCIDFSSDHSITKPKYFWSKFMYI